MKMSFSGRSLEVVGNALKLAIDEVHNQIATCPDRAKYWEDIEVLREEQDELEKLRNRVYKKLGWEN